MFLKRNEERNFFHAILSASVLFLILCSINAFADSIIDNDDPDTSFTGTWKVSGAINPWDPDDPSATSLWSRDGATYTWTFTPTDSGYHNFFLWWTEWPSRSNSVPVTISHWRGTDTLSINQQQDGGQWNFQDTYPFEAGVSYDITMTAVPGGTLKYSSSADAVQLVYQPGLNVLPVAIIDSISPNPALTDALITFTGHGDDVDGWITGWSWDSNRDGHLGDSATFTTLSPLSPGTHTISFTVVDNTIEESEPVIQTLIVQDTINEVIIDNGDSNTSFTGSWRVSGGADPWDPADYTATSLFSKDGDTYTWTFTPPISGSYEFSMWWTQYSSRSPNVPVSIEFSGGTDTVSIDQQSNGGMWNSLGSYPFVAGNSYDITITAVPSGTQNYSTCADAVRLVYTGDINQLPVATIDDISLKVAAPGDQISFEGSGVDNDGTVIGFEWRSDIDGILSDQNTFSTDDLLSPLSAGTHTIFFRVQDDQSLWSKDAVALVIIRDCNSPVTIMQLGNSITHGVGEISEVDLRTGFRKPLFQALKDADYYVDFVGDRSTGILVVPPFDIDHQGVPGIEANEVSGEVYNWLVAHPAEIVLLHIGTNDDTTNPYAVEDILNEIDRYEGNQGVEITVVLAKIINRQTFYQNTTIFNDNVQSMAEARIAAGDKIVIVDQESALNYATDMWDYLHPNNAGYNKMDDVWKDALVDLLPVCSDFQPFIFTSPITEATVGYPYTSNVGSFGDPAPSYSLLAESVGMSIDPTTGEISWTPASGQVGVHEITVQAENIWGTDTQDFSINVSESIIIDNGDSETSFTGNWSVSSGKDPWDPATPQPTSLWSRDGSTYTWTFIPLVSGEYEVSMWWTQFSSRSSNIPVSLEFSGGTDTITINQQTAGGQWNLLNSYPFVAGQNYDITITSQPGPTSTSADAVKFVLLSATSPSITSHPSNQTVMEGETATFSVAATGSVPLSYQWQKNGSDISGATAETYTTPPCTPEDSGALFRCVVTNTTGSAESNNATLMVNSAVSPSITSHPSDQTVLEGETATFSVTATGSAPLSYQWKKDGSDIPSATGDTYIIPATVLGDNGVFSCVVTNVGGSVTSNNATLTVNAVVAPSITSHPSDQTVTEGETATFSVAATGSTPLSYQWQRDDSNIPGATGATYTTLATILSDNGAMFRCVVTNVGGNATSDAATLTINEIIVAPSITTHPSGQTVIEGDAATFSVIATGSAPLSYQWQKDGSIIPGATSATYTTPATILSDNGALFSCVVTNVGGSATSNNATLTVNAVVLPSITTHPSDQTVLEGAPATFSVTATGSAPLSYQWQKDGSNIPGATNDTYIIPATVLGDNGVFSCVVTNVGGSVTSNNATLTVNAVVSPSITSHPSNQTVLEGETATFSVIATGSAPLSYQWQKNGSIIPGATAATYTTPAAILSDNGALFSCVVTNVGGSATSDTATLTINEIIVAPSITTHPSGQTVIEGDAATFSVTATGSTPLSYQWQKNGSIIPGATAETYTTPPCTPEDNGALFSCVVTNTAGTVTSDDATLVVNNNSASEVVIDNGDSGTSSTGAWSFSGGDDPWVLGDPSATSLYSRDGDTYTWTFIPPISGIYEFSMWWTSWPSRSTSVPVVIQHAGGSNQVSINQLQNGGQWNGLGVFNFVAGQQYLVTITSQPAPTSTCADAVRFVYQSPGGNLTPSAQISNITPNPGILGANVSLVGYGTDLDGTITHYNWRSSIDGELGTTVNLETDILSGGMHTIFFKVEDNDGAWSAEAAMQLDVVEHLYAAPGYFTKDSMPYITNALTSIGATQINTDLWFYQNNSQNRRYYIHLINTVEEIRQAFITEGAHLLFIGHSNYGLGPSFANTQEFNSQTIDDIMYIDDDRILNISTPWIHVSVGGMRTGQAYPHWWPNFQDGTSGIMPYDFGDPAGDPAYNYYLTYKLPGDPINYRIESSWRGVIERYPDSGLPAWYSPTGDKPDPDNPDHQQYFIVNPAPWNPSFDYAGPWVETMSLPGFFKENYYAAAAGSGSAQAQWLFSIPLEGDYVVSAWWPASSSNTTSAPYVVNHAGGNSSVNTNQRLNGGVWNELGTYHFTPEDFSVTLSNGVSSGNVIADAIRIKHVDNPPEIIQADFSAINRSGPAPLEVIFDSESTGDITNYAWTFGDGFTNYTRSYLAHIYDQPGTYTVSLTVSGPLGSNTTTEVGYITVTDAPAPLKAEFAGNYQSGLVPHEAGFIDRSSGDIVAWEWDFGDGETSTEPNPLHTYETAGNYTVQLTVTDSNDDTSTETKENFVIARLYDNIIDNVDYPKTHYRRKTLLFRNEMDVPVEDMKYRRMFYSSCDTGIYYSQMLQRGILFYTLGNNDEGEFEISEYLKAYLSGQTDYEIWQTLQQIEPIWDYFDFTKPPPPSQQD